MSVDWLIQIQKCDERLEAFLVAHKSVPDECKWFFQPVYQSTDESNDSAVLDPDTEVESDNEIHVSAMNKPWLSRAPMYRVEEVRTMPLALSNLLSSRFRNGSCLSTIW
jgi:hypothetical protein